MEKDARLPSVKDLILIFLIFASARAVVYAWNWGVGADFLSSWLRWDAIHYVNIAKHGYITGELEAQRVAFMSRFPPLYSAMIAFLSLLPGVSETAAGIFLSLLFLFLASVLLFSLAVVHFKDRTQAFLAVALLNFFPTAYFGNAPYTEGLFLFLSVFYFWALVRYDSYALATLAAVGMVLTRTAGIIVMVVHLHVGLNYYFRSRVVKVRDVLCFLAPIAVIVAQQVAVYLLLKQPGYLPMKGTVATVTPAFPLVEPVKYVITMFQSPRTAFSAYGWMTTSWAAIFMWFALGVLVWGRRALPSIYFTYALSYTLFISTLTWNISASRYVWVIFPLFLILARKGNRFVLGALFAGFVYGLLQFSRLYAMGAWAF